MLPPAQAINAILEPIADPFMGNWDIQQGSQIKVKFGGRSHYYVLFRDRHTDRVILQIGRGAQPKFYKMNPQTSMYEFLLLRLGEEQWSAGDDDVLLLMTVGRMFHDDRHASLDVVAI